MVTDDEGLHVEYTVAEHPDDVSDAALEERVSAYEYPSVWSLYNETGVVRTNHQIEFEAEHWEFLVRRRRWELSCAIADDSVEALGISSDAVVNMQMEVKPDRLTVVEKLHHLRTLTIPEIDEKLHDCPFERTWAIYESLTPSEGLVKLFNGENWNKIVEGHASALESAFASDTGKSLNLSRLEVEVCSAEVAGDVLKVVFVVRGSNLTNEEMQDRVNNYPYPETWALYGVPGGVTQFQGPHSQRIFDGKSWARSSRASAMRWRRPLRRTLLLR
ncbi:mitotubule-associated protein Gb4 [Strigomonas culicis]|uniref:Mitotubule-associated protein Gb4 n=1 Tax=Strigomonas culicis TaxID=28005 RepID=S9TIG7_9TRYP|nr:mitotubule-associated protein Gb4 [Strigomonas culicis]|eukprot:EPY17887.1 mitotubule-associated protein Gb4 [Strigomonas culicis]